MSDTLPVTPIQPVATTGAALLDVRDLNITFRTGAGTVHAVQHVSFSVQPNETLGLVGESGCGKSTTAMAIIGLLPGNGRVVGGEVRFQGRNMLAMSPRELRSLRGDRISMVFQNPMTSLDPAYTIGSQIVE